MEPEKIQDTDQKKQKGGKDKKGKQQKQKRGKGKVEDDNETGRSVKAVLKE